MRANRTEYLFSVNTHTPPTMTVDSGEEFTVEVRGAFDDVEDISAVPTPFTPACDGRQLAPIAGPIIVRGADVGFAPDSLLEQSGFEPLVPPPTRTCAEPYRPALMPPPTTSG